MLFGHCAYIRLWFRDMLWCPVTGTIVLIIPLYLCEWETHLTERIIVFPSEFNRVRISLEGTLSGDRDKFLFLIWCTFVCFVLFLF